MNGFVYFISNGEAVKIGYSADPAKRFQSLQTSQPGTLVLLGTIAGNRELERELHTRFADRRRVGEWFTADDVLIGAIEGLIANPPTIPSKRDRTRARLEDEALAQRAPKPAAVIPAARPRLSGNHFSALPTQVP